MKEVIKALMCMVKEHCTYPESVIKNTNSPLFRKDQVYTFANKANERAIQALKDFGYIDNEFILNWDKLLK